MFHLIFALPWLYVVTRFVWPLPWALPIKLTLSGVLLFASQYHFWSKLSSGSVFTPQFPRHVVIAFNWAFGAISLLAAFQIALDLLLLVATVFGRGGDGDHHAARYAIGVAAVVLAGIGVRQASRIPPLRDITVPIADLPAQFDGYTLVQLTDLHISRLFPARWAQAVVAATNALAPDLIVVTGDVIDGSVAMRERDVAPLAGLRAADGVYLIAGNHEYLCGYDSWMAHLSSLGMIELANSHAVFARGDDRLVLAGAPVILLDHVPGKARAAAERGVALQLSGHTHGGMIVGLDRVVARANGGFVSGLYAVGGMALYVNNGTGIWPGFALRLGKPSELTRITLRCA